MMSIEVDRSELEEIINALDCGYNESLCYDEPLNRSLVERLKKVLREN